MTQRNAVSTMLAASVLFSSSIGAFAQAPSPHAKTPSSATGSGADTGMKIQSGMSGNGPGGVGTIASASATGSKSGTSHMKMKKSSRHSSKSGKYGMRKAH